ncbi:tRNA-specific 2-thiouridylase MnmA [Dirofilaria immitis]
MMKQKYAFLDMYIRSCVFRVIKSEAYLRKSKLIIRKYIFKNWGSRGISSGNSASIDLMIIKHQSPCRARITKIGLRRIRFIAVSTFSGLKKTSHQ